MLTVQVKNSQDNLRKIQRQCGSHDYDDVVGANKLKNSLISILHLGEMTSGIRAVRSAIPRSWECVIRITFVPYSVL